MLLFSCGGDGGGSGGGVGSGDVGGRAGLRYSGGGFGFVWFWFVLRRMLGIPRFLLPQSRWRFPQKPLEDPPVIASGGCSCRFAFDHLVQDLPVVVAIESEYTRSELAFEPVSAQLAGSLAKPADGKDALSGWSVKAARAEETSYLDIDWLKLAGAPY